MKDVAVEDVHVCGVALVAVVASDFCCVSLLLRAFLGYGSKRFVDIYVTKRVHELSKQAICGRICH